MRLIIAGSRTVWPTVDEINYAISTGFGASALLRVIEIVSGQCPNGADRCGEIWADESGVPVALFPADWASNGKVAGKLRNRAMAEYADAALVFWDGMSSGSADMVCRMVARGKPVHVVPIKAGKR